MIGLWLAATAWAGTWTHVEEVTIAAPPEVVWAVLVDLEAYPAWNPWLIEAAGTMEVGGKVDATVLLPDPRAARHRVIEVAPYTRFCWEDVGWFTAMARGSRCRDLVAVPGGTQVRVELTVVGIASGMVARKFGDEMARQLAAETAAWKVRAESM